MIDLERIEPGQWIILRVGSSFYRHVWEGNGLGGEGRVEIDGFAAGPFAKLTAQFAFTSIDVRCSKRHDRDRVVAVVADRDAARALLWRIRERQLAREVACAPWKARISEAHDAAKADVEAILAQAAPKPTRPAPMWGEES